jgi:hypothetical protein
MSTLTVSNVSTPNANTPLTLASGNTTAAKIVVSSNNVSFYSNSSNFIASVNSIGMYVNNATDGINSTSFSAPNITGTGQLIASGNVTPSLIAANTSAWNPGTTGYTVRAQANNNNNIEWFISGLVAGTNGQEITLSNIGPTKITLRNEDSANETTAANRFNLPNHIVLGGYQSIQLYYDGILARWRGIDTLNYPFDHKYSLTKGFNSGGLTPTVVASSDRCTYSTETTAAVAGANLTQARFGPLKSGNADKGFISGGSTTITPVLTFVNTADRTTYSTETTAAVSGGNLTQSRWAGDGVGNSDKGFLAGGSNNADLATADRTTYSSETTAAVTGANLTQARTGPPVGIGNPDKGFYVGGYTGGTGVVTTNKCIYSTETTVAVTGANMSSVRNNAAGSGNADKGFVSGGSNPSVEVTLADRTTYSSETTAAVSGANLTQAKSAFGAAGNDAKGFFIASSPGISDRTTYSTETTAALSGCNLTQARNNCAMI